MERRVSLFTRAFDALDRWMYKASRGTLGGYTLNAPHQWGQPRPEVLAQDASGLITEARMREIALKTPTLAACRNATLDYATGVELQLRNIDPARPADPHKVALVQSFMKKPNSHDTWKRFLYKICDDIWTIGYAAVELERDADGNLSNLNVLDAARLKLDFDEHGTLLGYNMYNARGVPIPGPDGVHTWLPEEVMYFTAKPRTDTLYSSSALVQLFSCAILEDLMIYFISQKFTDSNVPFGVYDLGDVTQDELTKAKEFWNDQATNSNHRVLLTGSKNGGKWNVFGYHLKDLEATALLSEIRGKIMGVVGVTMNELGQSQDINKSNGYNLSFTFKKRAIEPLLNELVAILTRRFLWDTLGFTDLEYFYEEIDSRDTLLQAQIDKDYLDCGVYSINYVRNRMGLPNIPGGDEPTKTIGSSVYPVSMLHSLAQANLMALLSVEDGNTTVRKPYIEGPQPPKNAYNESSRIRYQPKSETPTKPDGGVETLRSVGLRKEEM